MLDSRITALFYWFAFFNTFLGAVLGGSLFQQLGTILSNPESWLQLLGTALPSASVFFLNYAIMHGLVRAALLRHSLGGRCTSALPANLLLLCFSPQPFAVHQPVPFHLAPRRHRPLCLLPPRRLLPCVVLVLPVSGGGGGRHETVRGWPKHASDSPRFFLTLAGPKCERDHYMIRSPPSYRPARHYGSFLLLQVPGMGLGLSWLAGWLAGERSRCRRCLKSLPLVPDLYLPHAR